MCVSFCRSSASFQLCFIHIRKVSFLQTFADTNSQIEAYVYNQKYSNRFYNRHYVSDERRDGKKMLDNNAERYVGLVR